MWIDEEGAFHTVSLPDPESRIDDDFYAEIERRVGELRSLDFEEMEDRLIEELESADLSPGEHIGEPLPDFIRIGESFRAKHGPIKELLESAIWSLPEMWRLDGLMVILDTCEALVDEE